MKSDMTFSNCWSRSRVVLAICLVNCVVLIDSRCVAEQIDRPAIVSDLASIRIQAESLKSEQLALGRRLLDQYPDSFNVQRIMGFVHSTHGNQAEMVKCWQKCKELSPDRPDIHDQLGRHAMHLEQYDEAIAHWKKTLELSPEFPGVQLRMGTAYLAAGRSAEATKVLAEQLKLTPDDPQTHYQLGESLFQQQQYEEAKRAFLRATELHAKHAKAYYGLVKTSARLGHSEEAAKFSKTFQQLEAEAVKADQEFRRNFDDLQQVRSDVATTFVDAGRIYASDEQVDKALRLWTRAAEIDPKNEMSRNFLAKVYLSRKQPKEAQRYMQQLVWIDPENPVYHEQVGMLMARSGKLADAEEHLRKVVQLEPKRGAGYRVLAKFYLNTKQRTQLSYELALRAVKLQPVADSYFVLGWASAQTNRPEQAKKALAKAIQMDPKNQTYRKLYESVFRSRRNKPNEER